MWPDRAHTHTRTHKKADPKYWARTHRLGASARQLMKARGLGDLTLQLCLEISNPWPKLPAELETWRNLLASWARTPVCSCSEAGGRAGVDPGQHDNHAKSCHIWILGAIVSPPGLPRKPGHPRQAPAKRRRWRSFRRAAGIGASSAQLLLPAHLAILA